MGNDNLRIAEIIDRIDDLIDSSATIMFSKKRQVDVEVLDELVRDLLECMPHDIQVAQKIIARSENIIAQAQVQAAGIIDDAKKSSSITLEHAKAESERMHEEAQRQFEEKVSEHSIYLEAQKLAEATIDNANAQAAETCDSSRLYADSVLTELLACLNAETERVTISKRNIRVMAANAAQENGYDSAEPDYNTARQRRSKRTPAKASGRQYDDEADDRVIDEPDEIDYDDTPKPVRRGLFGRLDRPIDEDFDFDGGDVTDDE